MEFQKALRSVCLAPSAFYRGGISFAQLLRDSGGSKSSLSKQAIVQILEVEPSLIDDWLLWSMNKRVSSGWYFTKEDNDYLVGFYPVGERFTFQDAAVACAEFILREVWPYAV